ncbi:hypothetical protein Cgig2_027033 [Carnegiea gigantea]|uniref:NAC domain-containing protein n=1 Tax=Carnegiea gigantea TaxID=171969 RepID=A0A9Q1QEG1_9CARY|nr:hypothetical protein Cgig2_027033 [Carnegiea gigantea]
MERMNFVKNGVLRLPPGFRFHPTDQELVLDYLTRKVMASPLPASVIPDFDVCKSDPWDLPGDSGQERYFFSTREAKYPNGNRSNRATLSGYWKATGKDKPILASAPAAPPLVVGMKKTLVFYRGKPPHGSRTDWIMHEYRLLNDALRKNNYLPQKTGTGEAAAGGWVLCRIFLKKRNNGGTKNGQEEDVQVVCEEDGCTARNRAATRPVFYDFLARERTTTDLNLPAPCSSSSGSSAVTELSSNYDNNNNNNLSSEECEESSSCCNSLSPLSSKP